MAAAANTWLRIRLLLLERKAGTPGNQSQLAGHHGGGLLIPVHSPVGFAGWLSRAPSPSPPRRIENRGSCPDDSPRLQVHARTGSCAVGVCSVKTMCQPAPSPTPQHLSAICRAPVVPQAVHYSTHRLCYGRNSRYGKRITTCMSVHTYNTSSGIKGKQNRGSCHTSRPTLHTGTKAAHLFCASACAGGSSRIRRGA